VAPPDFELATLSGDTVRLSDHLGRDVILIDFWATFCKPCLRSMPKLDALYEKYRARGFVVLGVSIDSPNELDEVRAMVSRMEIDFPILLDQETRVVSLYNPKTSAPYSVLIGRDGRVIRKQEGYTAGDEGSLDADVARALER
jgi:peroxiredoxin